MDLTDAQRTALVSARENEGAVSARPATVSALVRLELVEDGDSGPALTATGWERARELSGNDVQAEHVQADAEDEPSAPAPDPAPEQARDETLTTTWSVTNRAGDELCRVDAPKSSNARRTAYRHSAVRETVRKEGGIRMRRLAAFELE